MATQATDGTSIPQTSALIRAQSPICAQGRIRAFARVSLVVWIGLVLLCGLIVEAWYGAETAQWTIYHSWWWRMLWGLVGIQAAVSLIGNLVKRKFDVGGIGIQIGVMLLVAGAAITLRAGRSGQVSLGVGEIARQMTLADQSQLEMHWAGVEGASPQRVTFAAGPNDWPERRSLDAGSFGEYRVRVGTYYRHARPVTDWVDDQTCIGGPRVQFQVIGPQGKVVADHFLVDELFGDALLIGPVRMQLSRATSQAMLDDFLSPPDKSNAEHGLLLAYVGDAAVRIDVAGSMGQRVPIGDSGAAVKLAAYLPNARPDRMGNFSSKNDEAKNPMLEVWLDWPEKPEGRRQITFAREPLLNLDGVYGQECPVKLVYVHPAIPPATGIELLQGPDQQLVSRTCVNGVYEFHRQVKAGSRLKISDNFEFVVVDYRPHVRKQIRFEPSLGASVESKELGPAIRVDVEGPKEQKSVWIPKQTSEPYVESEVALDAGHMRMRFRPAQQELASPFRLASVGGQRDQLRDGELVRSSRLELLDGDERLVAAVEPELGSGVTHDGAGYHLMVSRGGGHGRPRATLAVVSDPGRIWKLAGMLLICTSLTVNFWRHGGLFGGTARTSSEELQ